ncbi:WhiB family transcriptional regulator [Streptomyces sp. NPDC047525]|uniref:WhiB family transcriptional regulator n=1 Tax=Streptomyces sp. NPDC047525 TaxID=3155264 RepID=UPI0033CD6EAE
MEWMTSALCAREDPELFFPVTATGPALREELAAKRICLRCPVLRPCLTWAIDSGQAYGVWGGTNAEQRAVLRQKAGSSAPAHLTSAEPRFSSAEPRSAAPSDAPSNPAPPPAD